MQGFVLFFCKGFTCKLGTSLVDLVDYPLAKKKNTLSPPPPKKKKKRKNTQAEAYTCTHSNSTAFSSVEKIWMQTMCH